MSGQMMNRKRRYPWRLGATSFVVPADLLTNVRLLAGMVDDVQLLFFESRARARMAHPVDIAALQTVAAESGLTYTAHLPGDVRLGSASAAEREAGLDEIIRLLDELEPLAVKSFDLHLPREPELSEDQWLGNIDRSLAVLAERAGGRKGRICIENIDYPLALVEPLLDAHGFPCCLDVGHLLRYGYDWRTELNRYLPVANHIHYHGVEAGKDHEAVVKDQAEVSIGLANALARSEFNGVITLEMYDLDKLKTSLTELDAVWGEFSEE